MSSKQIKRLVFSALMLALATGLSLIPLGIKMPMGGKLTLCSMLPICLVSIKYGTKWGLLVSFTYSLIQLFLSLTELMSWGMTVFVWVGALVFDYLVAYTVLGIAGVFRKKGEKGVVLGVALAMFCRFFSHFISGCIFFRQWCWEGWNPVLYSICYNGAYMLPELIITALATWLLTKYAGKLFAPEY